MEDKNKFFGEGILQNRVLRKSGEILVNSDKEFIYICLFCKEQFLSNEEFVDHVSNHHFEDQNSDEKFMEVVKCGVVYDESSEKDADPAKHEGTCHELKEEDEDLVNYEETDSIGMNTPNQLTEENNTQVELLIETVFPSNDNDGFSNEDVINVVNGKKIYECGYCHKQFQSKCSSENHRSIHEGTIEFKCPEESCSKVFRIKKLLSKHMVIHRKVKPHKCEFCSHRSNYKSNLREHVRRCHTLEKPFKCQYCEKPFVSATEKQMHERVHTGEKPFVCELCGKEFKSTATLNYHLYKHNGVKKYSCTLCDKAFSSPSLLWEHSLTHSKDKKITCDVCGQKCKHAKSLRQHKRLHEDKRYVCKVCQKAFAQNSGLYIHMKSHKFD